jgi:hypothetical protein
MVDFSGVRSPRGHKGAGAARPRLDARAISKDRSKQPRSYLQAIIALIRLASEVSHCASLGSICLPDWALTSLMNLSSLL